MGPMERPDDNSVQEAWKLLQTKVLDLTKASDIETRNLSSNELLEYLNNVVERAEDLEKKGEEDEERKKKPSGEPVKTRKRYFSEKWKTLKSSMDAEDRADKNALLTEEQKEESKARKKKARVEKCKAGIDYTMSCIVTLGTIIVPVASSACPPSQIGLNLFTFIFKLWQGHEEILELIVDLLAECAEFMSVVDSYTKVESKDLHRLVCDTLNVLSDFCDLVDTLRKRGEKTKAALKQGITGDDGDLKRFKSKLERLRNTEARLVNAKALANTHDMMRSQERRDDRLEGKSRRQTIAAALGFPPTELKADNEPRLAWNDALRTRASNLVDGMGNWLLRDSTFKQWSESRSTEPFLVLKGDSKTGKTSLMTKLLSTIRPYREDPAAAAGGTHLTTHRVVTAYFFAESDRSRERRDEMQFKETSTRALLWQIATSYEAMTKSAAENVRNSKASYSAEELWKKMHFELVDRDHTSTTFLIYIDCPADETGLSGLLSLLQIIQKNRPEGYNNTRVFMTATREMTRELEDKKIPFDRISVTQHNGEDIEEYIKHSLGKIPRLHKPGNNPNVAERVLKIPGELRAQCTGDYLKINTALGALANLKRVAAIDDVINTAGEPQLDQMKARILKLNQTLGPAEIRDINSIITWVEGAKVEPTVEMMEIVLSLDHRPTSHSSGEANPVTGVLPFLEEQLHRYSTLFTVKERHLIQWSSPETKGCIENKSSPALLQITKIKVVRDFLRQVCSDDYYKHLGFEDYFGWAVNAAPHIHRDPENIHINIAINCLAMLGDGALGSSSALRTYIQKFLLYHLGQVDLKKADTKLKAEAGHLLVRLLTNTDAIDAMFWPVRIRESGRAWHFGEYVYLQRARCEWIYSSKGVKEVERWFRDDDVASGMKTDEGRDFIKAVATPGVNLHEALLSPAAIHMTRRLLCRIKFTGREYRSAGYFLRGYLWRLGELDLASSDPGRDDPSADESGGRGEEDFPEDSSSEGDSNDLAAKVLRLGPVRSDEMLNREGVDVAGSADPYEPFEDGKFTVDQMKAIKAWASASSPEKDTEDASTWNANLANAFVIFCLGDSYAEPSQELKHELRQLRDSLVTSPRTWYSDYITASWKPEKQRIKDLEELKKEIDLHVTHNKESWREDPANKTLRGHIASDLSLEYMGFPVWVFSLSDDGSQDDHDETDSDEELPPARRKAGAENMQDSLKYTYRFFSNYAAFVAWYTHLEEWDMVIDFVDALNKATSTWFPYLVDLADDFLGEQTLDIPDSLARAIECSSDKDKAFCSVENFFRLAMGEAKTQQLHEVYFTICSVSAEIIEAPADEKRRKVVTELRKEAWDTARSEHNLSLPRNAVAAVTDYLSEWHFDQALSLDQAAGPEAVTGLGLQLVDLAQDARQAWANIISACYLIRFHQRFIQRGLSGPDQIPGDHERAIQRKARNCVRTIVGDRIDLLSDDDDDNDDEAYSILALLFTTTGDQSNMKISWMMRFRDPCEAPSHLWHCDGTCDDGEGGKDQPMWSCADCIGLRQYEPDCYSLLKAGTLKPSARSQIPSRLRIGGSRMCTERKEWFRCGKSHILYEVPALEPSTVASSRKEDVPLPANEGALPTLDEWKKQLTERYLDESISDFEYFSFPE